MTEIIGCAAKGKFVSCADCSYNKSEIDCIQFIASSNAELKVSTTKKTSENLVQAAGMRL